MPKQVASRARRKIRKLLERMSQRELAELTGVKQPTVCQLSTGVRKNAQAATKRKFERVGITFADWVN